MIKPPRRLSPDEVRAVLHADAVAHLATLDHEGFPHVTPLWFNWAEGPSTSRAFRTARTCAGSSATPRAGICVDLEGPQRPDGERPNRQVRAVGEAELFADEGGVWTRRITEKYLRGPVGAERARQRSAAGRVVIRLRPVRMVAVVSV